MDQGRYNLVTPTINDGGVEDLQLTARGGLRVATTDAAGNPIDSDNMANDAVGTSQRGLIVGAFNRVYNGAAWDRLRTAFVFKSLAPAAIGAEATIWTPAAGKKFRFMGFIFSSDAAVSVILKDNTAGTTIFRIPALLVGTPLVYAPGGNGILSAAANNVLTATGSGAANLQGTVFGTEE